MKLMNICIEGFANGKTPTDEYVAMLFEWTKMFKHLGSAISIAFKGKI